ncbi:alpha/beta hydrolase [Gilvimarinus sp. SDUM040013]|uniref:Alpha/beta hydrolase n=1 Tax=Gilvimarinus gilvus TaxID=3058038 RepID=A0ABU4S6B3_9GAMM|nr:alpha/beta hydrolase [Gilvimarinus sp. SDUM040013]MDO3384907.1 alpha/beta hydrolase [Gilvimarinus sp. SDUM040013]MDX6851448.1 alpha/beta hydrolase [Gilvimarinus sp. SDUM040013]
MTKLFGIITGLATLSACSSTDVLNTLNRAEHYRTHTSLTYGQQPRQTLDVYQPRQPDATSASCLVVFVYGGGWDSGRKEQYGFVGAQLAKRGHTVVIPDYRLYPDVAYPTFVEDVSLAIASEKVSELRNERPLILIGHSAGAMIAGLISYDDRYLRSQGLDKSVIDGYISLAGPHDYFLPSDKPRWVSIFGEAADQQRSALTVEHIHANNPRTLILHGADDDTVTPNSAHSLQRKLAAVNVSATKKIYSGVGHVRIMAAMAWPLHFLAPTLQDIDTELAGC